MTEYEKYDIITKNNAGVNGMFRNMRRFKQQLSEAETTAVLERGKTGVLGVCGDQGYPYTIPLNYVYGDGKIYIHSAKTGHKLDAIRQCSKVSFCVIDKDDILAEKLTTSYRSVILFGKARILEHDKDIYRAAHGLKYNQDIQAVQKEIEREWEKLCCVEIVIEHMTGKKGAMT